MTLIKFILCVIVVLIFYAAVNSVNSKEPEVWNAVNEWFGRDVIEDTPCMSNPNMKQAYSYNGNIIMIDACWFREGDNIHIIYSDNRAPRVYPISAFKTKGFGWF
jgi:hypothetical protein